MLNERNSKSGSGKSVNAKRVEISGLMKVPARKKNPNKKNFKRNFIIKKLLLEARAESRETVALAPI